MSHHDTLLTCLDDLESRIDCGEEERLLGEWKTFAEGRNTSDIFSPRRSGIVPPRVEWPAVTVNAALDDFDLMALQQYKNCSDLLADGRGYLMCVRSNYGTGILPSLFGVRLFIMEDSMNTLPGNWPLDDPDAIRKAIDGGVPDLQGGWGAKVFEMGRRYAEIARQYPNIGRHVHVYHPDLQGPMDICELLWGSSMFYTLVEDPPLIKEFLDLITRTYIAFMREWTRIFPFDAEGNMHWGYYHRGSVMLRDDSAMNLSPEMFNEFIRPHDQRILDEFGGGCIHFCGRGDHYIHLVGEMRGVNGVNLSQPEYNDMETNFRNTIDKGIVLLDLSREAAERALAAGRTLHGRVSCPAPASDASSHLYRK